jgi:hypothetical protein
MHFFVALAALLSASVTVQALPSIKIPSPALPATGRPPVLNHVTFNNDTDGHITFEKDTPNGLYIYHNQTHFSYHGEADTSASTIRRVDVWGDLLIQFQHADRPAGHSENDGPERRQTSCSAYCQGGVLNGDDATAAINGLAKMAGDGIHFNGVIVYNFGDASAFGCDYGKDQLITGGGYLFDINCMTSFCGVNNIIGWNSHNSWRSKFGVNIVGFSCSG